MRERKPYWKSSHHCYYFRYQGREVRLDPDKDRAWAKWHEIKGGQREVSRDAKVIELIALFLDWSKRSHRPLTYQWYKDHLDSFQQSHGTLRVSALKPFHVTAWSTTRFYAVLA